jgi:copper chaperone CopZ
MTYRSVLPLLFALLLAGATLPSPGQAQDSPPDSTGVQSPDATVYVDGLGCPFCAYGLEKKLQPLNAVKTMEVQLEKGRVLLAFREGQSLTEDEIQEAVKKAGFTARKIEFPDEASRTSPSP